jgi:hypothetical protein
MKTRALLTAGIAALLLATGAAHADSDLYKKWAEKQAETRVVPKTIFILWALEANTKTYEWILNETYETLQECLDKKKELENKPTENKDVKGFTRSLKCIRYLR